MATLKNLPHGTRIFLCLHNAGHQSPDAHSFERELYTELYGSLGLAFHRGDGKDQRRYCLRLQSGKRLRPTQVDTLWEPLLQAHRAWAVHAGNNLPEPPLVSTAPTVGRRSLLPMSSSAFPLLSMAARFSQGANGAIDADIELDQRKKMRIRILSPVDSFAMSAGAFMKTLKKDRIGHLSVKIVPGPTPAMSQMFVWARHAQEWLRVYGVSDGMLNEDDAFVEYCQRLGAAWLSRMNIAAVEGWEAAKTRAGNSRKRARESTDGTKGTSKRRVGGRPQAQDSSDDEDAEDGDADAGPAASDRPTRRSARLAKYAEAVLREQIDPNDVDREWTPEERTNVWMVGDNPAADILGANNWGFSSALTRTGVYRDIDGPPAHRPTVLVVDVEQVVKVARLPDVVPLREEEEAPEEDKPDGEDARRREGASRRFGAPQRARARAWP
ncbi:hypothetical protein OC842_002649 [Tilletia horrida]|uniref:Uncharacterized protein n=1 Tax=Tilletia horrida TaxID=155126 RepID=A0AAN6JRZ8_9BASI|nr:hypothetical protein OC842_002649 [Tilletia horrida]